MNRKFFVIAWLGLLFSIGKLYSQGDTNAGRNVETIHESSLQMSVIRIGYPAAMLSHVDSRDARVAIELWANQ